MINGMPSQLVLMDRVRTGSGAGRIGPGDAIDKGLANHAFVHGGPGTRPSEAGAPAIQRLARRAHILPAGKPPASEGFNALQDTRNDPGLRLLADVGNFCSSSLSTRSIAAIRGDTAGGRGRRS